MSPKFLESGIHLAGTATARPCAFGSASICAICVICGWIQLRNID
jgi:hypothetical protein